MTKREIELDTIPGLPDYGSLEEIAECVEFMAAVQRGLDQLGRGEGIPHDEVKDSLPYGLQTNLDFQATASRSPRRRRP